MLPEDKWKQEEDDRRTRNRFTNAVGITALAPWMFVLALWLLSSFVPGGAALVLSAAVFVLFALWGLSLARHADRRERWLQQIVCAAALAASLVAGVAVFLLFAVRGIPTW